MPVFCGIDWAEDHHDVAIVDDDGIVLMTRRIQDSAHGYQELLELLAEQGDNQDDPIPVAIETSRGLLVACLRRSGRQVYAINPLSVARYRDRHSLTRAKSDRVDLFPSRKRAGTSAEVGPVGERALVYIVNKYAEQARVRDLSPHDLRHRFGYRMAQTVPLHRLAQLMGDDSLGHNAALCPRYSAGPPASGRDNRLGLASLQWPNRDYAPQSSVRWPMR